MLSFFTLENMHVHGWEGIEKQYREQFLLFVREAVVNCVAFTMAVSACIPNSFDYVMIHAGVIGLLVGLMISLFPGRFCT